MTPPAEMFAVADRIERVRAAHAHLTHPAEEMIDG